MKNILTFLALAWSLTTPSFGQPASGATFIADSIMCDTKEQITSIVIAGAKDFAPAFAAFDIFAKSDNDVGQPICAYGKWMLTAKDVYPLPDFMSLSGPNKAWVIEVLNEDASLTPEQRAKHPTYFVLWLEPIGKPHEHILLPGATEL